MKEKKLSLFASDSALGLSDTLISILLSNSNPSQEINQESFPQPHCSQTFSELLDRSKADLIFAVLSSAGAEEGRLLLESAKISHRKDPVILVFKEGRPDEIIEMLRLGASDFLLPPLRAADILPRIWRFLHDPQKDERVVSSLKAKIGLKQIVGQSSIFVSELEKVPIVARCNARVLISGETGTGKELFARAIHYLSPRADKPFVPVSCGAIPSDLMENELFGHKQGAFTGADSSQPGLIQEAGGGTLFLDEIDCLPLQAQTKLLRFIQEKEYKPLGSAKTCNADVRVIAATNIDLEKSVQNGKFRRDLYYRLNVIPFNLPPLRDRRGDILLLAAHFLKKYSFEYNKNTPELNASAAAKLLAYRWPGNIRELEHIIERTVMFSSHPIVQDTDISFPPSESNPVNDSLREAKSKAISLFEKKFIEDLLLIHQGNITASAKAAGKNRRAFWELIQKYKIDAESFRSRSMNQAG